MNQTGRTLEVTELLTRPLLGASDSTHRKNRKALVLISIQLLSDHIFVLYSIQKDYYYYIMSFPFKNLISFYQKRKKNLISLLIQSGHIICM